MKHFSKYLFAILLLAACGENEPVKQANSEEYLNLRVGAYQVYSVEQTTYSELDPPEESNYELKTEVVDSFPNLEGGFTYVIHRSTRDTEIEPWEFQESWSARTNTSQAVLTEGNVAYIRIGLPAYRNKEWNGNALNTLPQDFYIIESAGGSYEVDSELQFDDVLIINQEDELNNLFQDHREEVYARNVGLVYKQSIVLNYCDQDPPPPSPPCFGQQIIKDGVEYTQVLKEYGQN